MQPVFLPNVPTDKRYSVHARCVSSGIEGEETVVESFDRNEIRSDKKQANLACKELRKSKKWFRSQDTNKWSQILK